MKLYAVFVLSMRAMPLPETISDVEGICLNRWWFSCFGMILFFTVYSTRFWKLLLKQKNLLDILVKHIDLFECKISNPDEEMLR